MNIKQTGKVEGSKIVKVSLATALLASGVVLSGGGQNASANAWGELPDGWEEGSQDIYDEDETTGDMYEDGGLTMPPGFGDQDTTTGYESAISMVLANPNGYLQDGNGAVYEYFYDVNAEGYAVNERMGAMVLPASVANTLSISQILSIGAGIPPSAPVDESGPVDGGDDEVVELPTLPDEEVEEGGEWEEPVVEPTPEPTPEPQPEEPVVEPTPEPTPEPQPEEPVVEPTPEPTPEPQPEEPVVEPTPEPTPEPQPEEPVVEPTPEPTPEPQPEEPVVEPTPEPTPEPQPEEPVVEPTPEPTPEPQPEEPVVEPTPDTGKDETPKEDKTEDKVETPKEDKVETPKEDKVETPKEDKVEKPVDNTNNGGNTGNTGNTGGNDVPVDNTNNGGTVDNGNTGGNTNVDNSVNTPVETPVVGGNDVVNDIVNEGGESTESVETPEAVKQHAAHTVLWGDTLYGIATTHGIQWQDLAAFNNIQGTLIYPGQVLIIPGVYVEDADGNVVEVGRVVHVVKAGETLSGIAIEHGTTWQKLQEDNKIVDENLIYEGQEVVVNESTKANTNKTEVAKGNYIVKSGDTLSSIARANGTTWDALFAANDGITDANVIFPGQSIVIK